MSWPSDRFDETTRRHANRRGERIDIPASARIVCPVCGQIVTAPMGTRPSKLCTDKDGWTFEHADMRGVPGVLPW